MCRNGKFCIIPQCESIRKNAACLLTISDSLVTSAATTAEERQTSFNAMMEVALEAAISL